ncbi:SLBB domain-containing protein [Gammaproteobacteria bacterium]|mgnify:CR=1 FL=1|nr:SLBB domain-containing protein [Gammaproteobacteria bacterium]|tara:strand:- start:2359 stop:4128 length:1770 start_codon:yes stop_codon:yes gene_type:complete
MKKIILGIFIVFSTTIYSQELSEAYLESLPESVKSDVLKGLDSKNEKDKPVYKRPSSMVEKEDVEYAQYKEFKDVENENKININSRFGQYIFQSVQSSFMPINEPNFDGSYLLDFGDALELQLVGQKNKIEQLSVSRDGSINLPEIGKIFVSGLTLDSATSLIKNKIKNAYIGIDAFVTLVNIRDIQILISGSAYRPGMYTLNGNSSILQAIVAAGGIDNNGTYREINLIRNNKIISSIDLYDIFIFGDSSFASNLRSGDTIHIPQHKNLVHAISGVNRPMIYELNPDETFMDLVNYANGFISNANLNSILVERISNGIISTFNLKKEDLVNNNVNDNDSLVIEEFVFGKVEIKGAVRMPGFYKITENTSLSNVLNRAGGYKNTAYPFGGHLNNKKTALLDENAKDELYNKFIKDLITGYESLDQSSLDILAALNEVKPEGRVMAEFDIDVLKADPSLDTRLEDGDEIIIPYIAEQVYVYGEINSQGTVKYVPGQSPAYYITNSGGFLKTANTKGIYIIHPNGQTYSINFNNRSLGFLSRRDKMHVYPGSIIFVPQKSNISTAKTASVWAPIISSIALSLTSLSVLNNN